jgi:protein-S-isoprenylcysteine O-methyltransferase Ste14
MVVWEFLINKTHLRATTGLDFSKPAPLAVNLRRTAIKLVGLWGTWALIGIGYWLLPTYEEQGYQMYLSFLRTMMPVIAWLSAIYILVLDRYCVVPEDDGCWHAGLVFTGRPGLADREVLRDHFLGWLVKAFFLPFMMSILPHSVDYVTSYDFASLEMAADPLVILSVNLLFLFDVSFGTIGYIFALRLLDTHIRTPNPFLASWLAALMCYPPFLVVRADGPINYGDGYEWMHWLSNYDSFIWVWGTLIIFLAAVYAWSTIVFGLRFSNLTHRGIITNGPYRYSKHPAYLSKNIFWWAVNMPFLSMAGWDEAARNSIMLALVNLIYYWRAKTEEKHLLADPVYQKYSQWIAEHGVLAKVRSALVYR